MDRGLAALQRSGEPWRATAEEVDPDRRVDQDHRARVRRRRGARAPGILPPSLLFLQESELPKTGRGEVKVSALRELAAERLVAAS